MGFVSVVGVLLGLLAAGAADDRGDDATSRLAWVLIGVSVLLALLDAAAFSGDEPTTDPDSQISSASDISGSAPSFANLPPADRN